MDLTKLADYGIMGIVLSYFIWKDIKTFETFKESMREIVDELKELNIRIDKLEKNEKGPE
jgi:CRISPR/Cas system CSM-associated protein Csm2 small subunit